MHSLCVLNIRCYTHCVCCMMQLLLLHVCICCDGKFMASVLPFFVCCLLLALALHCGRSA